MKKTKAIIFDLGGVLVDLDMRQCIEKCKKNLGFERVEEFLDPYHQKGFFRQFEAGNIALDDFRNMVVSMCKPGIKPEEADEAFSSMVKGMAAYKVDLLKKLSSQYELFVLSNNNAAAMPCCYRIFEEMGLPMHSVFRQMYLSHELHLVKPNDDIFQYAIKDIQRIYAELHPDADLVLPSDILYIDDSQTNVDAALRNGLNAVLYVQGGDLSKLVYDSI